VARVRVDAQPDVGQQLGEVDELVVGSIAGCDGIAGTAGTGA
jgi:hypothetical protein